MKLKELKKGDYFTLKSIENPTEKEVFIKGEYDRTEKRYLCVRFSDICDDRMIKGDKEVYTEFTF